MSSPQPCPAFLAAPSLPFTQTAYQPLPQTSPTSLPPHRRSHIRASHEPQVAFVLSHFEANDLLPLRNRASEAPTTHQGPFSIDIGLRTLPALTINPTGISTATTGPAPPIVATWAELKKIAKKGRAGAYECYNDGHAPQKIAGISNLTQRTASLLPCAPLAPPTMVLGGFGMHRLKGTHPGADTDAKIRAVGRSRLRGHVLDICTGLGYTAIAAADCAAVVDVTTIELDPVVVEIQRRNPWSQRLFNDAKIRTVEGDATEVLRRLPDEYFSVIIHDPPAQAMGGELYSGEFYRQLRRVSTTSAVLFHYIGDPSSQESGRLFRGVMSRLGEAGFRDLRKDHVAYGVTAVAG